MKIKNTNFAGGETVAFKSGTVTSGADGVFDVPDDKEAKAIVDNSTAWVAIKSGKAPKSAPEPASAPADADDLTEEVSAAVDEVTLPEEETEEIDIDALTKGQLIKLAAEESIDIDPMSRKADIKEAIEAALGGD